MTLLVVLSTACTGKSRPMASAASPQGASRTAPAAPYGRRVVLDSGEIHVAVTSAAAAITVISPEGTFVQAFKTNAPLVAWSATITASLPNASDAVSSAPTAEALTLRDSLPAPIDPEFPTTFWLERTVQTPTPSYRLGGTNGAWVFALTLQPAEVAALAAALRSEEAEGVKGYEAPRQGRTPAQSTPSVEGAWLALQVDQPVANPREPIELHYPPELRNQAVAGAVRLSFIVDSTGLVRPSSIRLIGKPPALQARAAKEQVMTLRFRPAIRLGRPVSQLYIHDFRIVP